MKKQVKAALFCLICAFSSYAQPYSYFVSPSGDDKNPGTEEAPFKTIEQAQKQVRSVNASMDADITVYLRGGTYCLTKTLSFTNADGGTDGHYVRYVNYPGETPLVTGGIPIKEWTLHDPANNIWAAANVDARFRQLYVNGKKAIRARQPNLKSDGSHNFYRLAKVDTAGKRFEIYKDQLGDWEHLDKVEMHLMIAWAESILRLKGITYQGNIGKVEVQDPEFTMIWRRKYPMLGVAFSSNPPRQQCFYLENAYEFIDQEGEWYLDESENVLYYKAREGEDMNASVVVAPRLENLVTVQGESTSQKVGYLAFQGITFAHSNFTLPSEKGFMNLQAGLYHLDVLDEKPWEPLSSNKFLLKRPAAGFVVENAHHIRVERNVFAQMAMTGLDFISGTNDDMIQGNIFTDLGAAGIMIGKFSQDDETEIHIAYNPADKNEICTRDTIKNNYIHHVTTESQGSVGIGGGYPRDIVIEHNEVAYMNYSGISVGFGWTKDKTAMTNNHINWNYIHHVSQLLADCGPIYTLSNQGESGEIQHNYITNIKGSEWADYWVLPIYLDEGSSGFEVAYNVYKDAPGGNASNQAGTNYCHDNDGYIQEVVDYAGIERDYKSILTQALDLIPNFSELVAQAPYTQPFTIPGIIQMEDYDLGGQGISFNDKDYVNEGKVYREDGVDIVAFGDSLNPDYAIGYTNPGEWLEYTLNVEAENVNLWKAHVSAGLDNASFRLFLDGKAITDTIAVPNGDSWDLYTTINGELYAPLPSGEHVLRVLLTAPYGNIDWIQLTDAEGTGVEDLPVDAKPHTLAIYAPSGLKVGSLTLQGVVNAASIAQAATQSGLARGVYFVQNIDGRFIKYIHTK